MDWIEISKKEHLSEEFMREHQKKLIWHVLSKTQVLQENFIIEMKESVNWKFIAMRQHLSFDFILAYIAYIDVEQLKLNSHYKEKHTKEFWEEIKNKKKENMESYLKMESMQKKMFNKGKTIEYTGTILFLKEYALAKQYISLEVEMNVPHQSSSSTYVEFFWLNEKTKEPIVVPFEELYENKKEKLILEHSILHFLQEQGEERRTLRFK